MNMGMRPTHRRYEHTSTPVRIPEPQCILLGLDIRARREIDRAISGDVQIVCVYDLAAGVEGGAVADARG